MKEAVKGLFVFAIGHDEDLFPKRIDIGMTQTEINEEYKNNVLDVIQPSKKRKIASTTQKSTNQHLTKHIHNDANERIYLRPVQLKGPQLEAYINSFTSEIITTKDLSQNEMWNQSRKHCRGLWFKNNIKDSTSAIFDAIYNDSKDVNGVIAVYCFFVEEGMYWFEEYLKSKGVRPFQGEYDDQGDKNGNDDKCDYYFNFAR